nr:MAG TPA: hypothetical protein [Caudoviricetes sp.]
MTNDDLRILQNLPLDLHSYKEYRYSWKTGIDVFDWWRNILN